MTSEEAFPEAVCARRGDPFLAVVSAYDEAIADELNQADWQRGEYTDAYHALTGELAGYERRCLARWWVLPPAVQ
jgi:hypothetical protein